MATAALSVSLLEVHQKLHTEDKAHCNPDQTSFNELIFRIHSFMIRMLVPTCVIILNMIGIKFHLMVCLRHLEHFPQESFQLLSQSISAFFYLININMSVYFPEESFIPEQGEASASLAITRKVNLFLLQILAVQRNKNFTKNRNICRNDDGFQVRSLSVVEGEHF